MSTIHRVFAIVAGFALGSLLVKGWMHSEMAGYATTAATFMWLSWLTRGDQ